MNTIQATGRAMVVAIAALGFAAAGCDDGVDTTTVNPTAPAAGAGTDAGARTAGDVGDGFAEGIYGVLAEATEAAVTDNGFDDLVERFAANDRGRFAGIADADFKPLNDAVRPALNAYKAKYGEDFDINDPRAVFAPLVNVQPKNTTGDTQTARVVMQPKVQGQNLPPYDLSMVKDGSWKIDIRDDYDRESLRMELVSQLSKITQGQANWPGDKVDGQRVVAYRVLAALSNSIVGGIEADTPPVTSP